MPGDSDQIGGPTATEHTISTVLAYLFAIAILVAALVGFVAIHLTIWGIDRASFPYSYIAIFIPLTVAHELLHGVGFRLAGIPGRASASASRSGASPPSPTARSRCPRAATGCP